MQIVPDPTSLPPKKIEPAKEEIPPGKKIVERLRRGELPQMVDWFDPGLLAKIGVRSIISTTLGQYTDQRLMQAASDNVKETELAARYDYSGIGKAKPSEALPKDADDAVWVDYIADLGDGFEATYAMAYLLAPDQLQVQGVDQPLPAAPLMVMGGDQVYPDATKQEYQNRLLNPYEWAFTTDNPQRKLFAIPGNHDWYDGLSSFSALFCSARDRISGGLGRQIGGWRCHQHRSYFAIKLPHNWWIWGPDIQLADNLDDSQRDYFDLMAEQTDAGHNIILLLAEPSWLHKNYDNMHEISMLARKNGAKICAIIAGDWHHYSRYTSDKLGIQFITCGGGGAFAHATHGLKRKLKLKWASPTTATQRTADPADPLEFNQMEKSAIRPGGRDYHLTQSTITADAPASAPASPSDEGSFFGRRAKALRKEDIASADYTCHAPHIYPPQWKSRLLCLKNLYLPFHNKRFGVLVGVVYFIYAWAFVASDPRFSPVMRSLVDSTRMEVAAGEAALIKLRIRISELSNRLATKDKSPGVRMTPADIEATPEMRELRENVQLTAALLNAINERKKAMQGKAASEVEAYMAEFNRTHPSVTAQDTWENLKITSLMSLKELFDPKSFLAAAEQGPMFAFILLGLWIGLVYYVDLEATTLGMIGKLAFGSVHFLAHIGALLLISWFANASGFPMAQALRSVWPDAVTPDIVRITWNLLITLVFGGLLGGLIMGLYWTLTSTLFNMHTGDAFGALGIRNYKNFLRIKLEHDRATIYAIALDKVPGRRGWRWKLKKGEVRPAHNPQILPAKPLKPRLIEPPVVIKPAAVVS